MDGRPKRCNKAGFFDFFLCVVWTLYKGFLYFFTECSFAEVVASKPCLRSGAGITDEECREMSEECCILKKFSGYSKCLRAD